VGSSSTWTNPTDACTSNDTRASYNGTGQGVLFIKDWGFSIPSDRVITGITVTFNGCSPESTATRRRISANLTIDGTNVCNSTWKTTNASSGNLSLTQDSSAPICAAAAGTDGDEVAGTTTDYWCTSQPTPTEVNSSNFGVMVRDYNATAHLLAVDQVSVSIEYVTTTTTTTTSSTTTTTNPKRNMIVGN